MPDRSDRANRAPREKITPEQVFNVFDEVRGPVITSIDVSDELSCSNATANRKLDKLVKKNKVDRRAIDGNATLYWRKNS